MISPADREKALIWLKNRRETVNPAFFPLLFDSRRYLVLKGGGGSGKSVFAGRLVLERVTSEKGHRWLVTRKVARTLRESCFAQLRSQAAALFPGRVKSVGESEMKIRFDNGGEILFAGLDDVEKLKSIFDVTGVWVEEATEISEADFNQLDIRLRTDFPYPLQMILTFNPTCSTHWLKRRFFDAPDPRAAVSETTYRDNRFLSREAVETLESFKNTDEYYYTVYCLGQWGTTGKTVFNGPALRERLDELTRKEKTDPPPRGFFECGNDKTRIDAFSFVGEAGGPVTLFFRPEAGKRYYIGADTAGEGSDWFCAQVLDEGGRQAATLRTRNDEETFTRQLYCLGRTYNSALIALEVNFSTYPVRLLESLGYREQYVREVADTFEHRIRRSFGFRTDSTTRPLILSTLIAGLRENVSLLNDPVTIGEALTFVRNEKLRPEAEKGAHDDTVMALAIAFFLLPGKGKARKRPADKSRWTKRMREDWAGADAEGRRMLEEKWSGFPRGG